MLTNEELAAYLEVGNELRAIEFKGNRDTQSAAYIAKVARACIAMSNQRDGGHVILGVLDNDPRGDENGLQAVDHALWSNQDWAADKINRFADPPLDLRIETRSHPLGGKLVVIEVAEFSQVPTLCQRDSDSNILKVGQLYTRSIRKPESTSYHSQNEMRELIDLAVSKGLRRYVETGHVSGISFDRVDRPQAPFQEQINSFFSTPENQGLLSQPHFRYLIHPQSFDANRVPYEDLQMNVSDAAVSLRGTPFPFVRTPSHDHNFIHESMNGSRNKGWAMFMSGLFIQVQQIGEWPSDLEGYTDDEDTRVQGNMPAWLFLLEFSEALEFAARLRERLNQAEPMIVRAEGVNLRGQRLVVANPRRGGFFQNYIYEGESWKSEEYTITDDSSVSGTRGLAMEAARALLIRFGWTNATREILAGMQDEAFNR